MEAWEPNVDMNLWKSKNEICLVVQSTQQGNADKAVGGDSDESRFIYLYFIKEK